MTERVRKASSGFIHDTLLQYMQRSIDIYIWQTQICVCVSSVFLSIQVWIKEENKISFLTEMLLVSSQADEPISDYAAMDDVYQGELF